MTPERLQSILQSLNRRQPDLTVVMENVRKPHNLAAVARTADAVGLLDVHAVTPSRSIKLSQMAAIGAHKWIQVHTHHRVTDCIARLKQSGHQIVTAHIDEQVMDYREADYTRPTAILLGTELEGISDEALAQADVCVRIPIVGLVQSLNVSVASALILYEALRQRESAGLYEQRRLDEARFKKLLFEWCHPKVAKYCRRKQIPYPAINDQAEFLEPLADSINHFEAGLSGWLRRQNL